MRSKISRRDFMNGVALSVAAGSSLSPLELLAMSGETPYPPGLTGLRGSHPGSFEVAHAVSWAGTRYPRPAEQTGDTYDLVVVGGGISGLASAHFYRERVGAKARILVLDNHDDFGGHAKRNEFNVDGNTLLCHGGSQTIDTPGHYSPVAGQLLKDVGIRVERFYEYFDRSYFRERNLRRGIYFSEAEYGRDLTTENVLGMFDSADTEGAASILAGYPLPPYSRRALSDLLSSDRDYLPDLSRSDKIAYLRSISYLQFLGKHANVPLDVQDIMRDTVRGYWGLGWDALSALEAYRFDQPGTQNLGIGKLENEPEGRDEPYIFHFPDGNAGVAWSLVRKLLPEAIPGNTMEDLVTSRVDYGLLDRDESALRIRLNSTAVDVRHAADGNEVDVTYVQNGQPYRVRGKHLVLACYNNIVPHICTELPAVQGEAIAYASKVPLVYISIAIRNWRAFNELGYHTIYIPRPRLMHSFGMDFPVSMGDYSYTQQPDQPAVVHGTFVPTVPGQGLSGREQHIQGRRALYEMSFDDFENDIVAQMDGALGAGGFDAARDIAAITVNRWPHGYAYEYNDLFDPADYNRNHGPHVAGRAQLGRISIANSDAQAYAYVNGAIDAADRAVNEQIRLS